MFAPSMLSPGTGASDDGASVVVAGTIVLTKGETGGDEGGKLVKPVGLRVGVILDDGAVVEGVDGVTATGFDVGSATAVGAGVPAAGFIEGAWVVLGRVGFEYGEAVGTDDVGANIHGPTQTATLKVNLATRNQSGRIRAM